MLIIFRDFSEFVGVSVKELVKAMGESRANGNGATPPETPRRMSRSSSPKNPQGGSPRFHSPSSSPVPIPGMYVVFAFVKHIKHHTFPSNDGFIS